MRSLARGAVGLVGVLLVVFGPSGAPSPAAGQAASDDPGFSRQWGLATIGAPAAWATATGSGITVAVVDSGVDAALGTHPGHPDLAGQVVGLVDCVGHDEIPGGCVENVASALDDAGHGTHVAGIVAAATGNGQGVAGVAPGARVLSIKVLKNECTPDGSDADADPECEASGRESDVAQGVRWAADRGAAVINLSLGNEAQAILGPGDDFAAALDYAWARGSIPVLVAGNDLLLPGSLVDVPAVIVAATTRADTRAPYSNGVGNVRWAVAAPGGEADSGSSCESPAPNGILSTYFRPTAVGSTTFPAPNGPTYACVAGTSMAAPHVAGALAVLRSAGLNAQQAVDRLIATADDLGAPGHDNAFGSGRINLARAVEGLSAAGAGPATPVGSPTTAPPPVTADTTATTAAVAPGTIAPPAVPGTTEAPTTSSSETTVSTAPGDEEAGAAVPSPLGPDDSLPAIPLTVAVLAVVGVLSAHIWRYVETAPWARRTPLR